jgi:hypothetical protein
MPKMAWRCFLLRSFSQRRFILTKYKSFAEAWTALVAQHNSFNDASLQRLYTIIRAPFLTAWLATPLGHEGYRMTRRKQV